MATTTLPLEKFRFAMCVEPFFTSPPSLSLSLDLSLLSLLFYLSFGFINVPTFLADMHTAQKTAQEEGTST